MSDRDHITVDHEHDQQEVGVVEHIEHHLQVQQLLARIDELRIALGEIIQADQYPEAISGAPEGPSARIARKALVEDNKLFV